MEQTTMEVLQNYGGMNKNNLTEYISDDPDDPMNDHIMPSYYYDMDNFKAFLRKERGLKILSLNCCSLRAKYDDIYTFMQELLSCNLRIDILCLQETWLRSGELSTHLHINGFKFISQSARISNHGGLGIYIRNGLEYKSINTFQLSEIFEAQFIEILSPGINCKKITLGNIYRPPRNANDNYDQFLIEFQSYLNALNTKRHPIILAGDYNIDLLQISTKPAFMEIYQMITASSFIPKVTFPTRYNLNGNSCSLLDNFFVNISEHTLKAKPGILLNQISDHLLCFISIDINCSTSNPKHVLIKKSSHENYVQFREELRRENLSNIVDQGYDPDMNYNRLNDYLTELHKKHFPVVQKRFNKRKHFVQPWMNYQILNSINMKNRVYKEILVTDHRCTKYFDLRAQLRNYNKEIRSSVRAAKRSYFTSYFKSNCDNMEKTWNKINELIGSQNKHTEQIQSYFLNNGQIVTGDKNIANAFNNYFVNITNIMIDEIDPPSDSQQIHDYLINQPRTSFSFNTITSEELIKAAKDIKSKNSSGHDELTTKLVKYVIQDIKDPLTTIYNQCITQGVFPNLLKLAKVLPIYKKGDSHSLGNYRPISLLPAISKIFEKLIYNEIVYYFISNELFHSAQYGFRKNHSTELACVELTDRIIKSFEESKDSVGVFLDLSRAFDLIDHNIMIKKLHFYGFDENALALCKNYLTERTQYVVYNNEQSEVKPACISRGIPQGSLLGPLYFLIYINDFPNASNLFNFIMYADDTTLETNYKKCMELCNSPNPGIVDINEVLNNNLNQIQLWLNINKLILNVDKTKFMVFHPHQRSRYIQMPTLEINGNAIDIVTEFNFLGINLDQHMTWKKHIHYLASKLNRVVGIINRLKFFIDKNTLKIIYHALFTPHINYGVSCWGYTQQSQISKVQKKAVRAITRSTYRAHTEPLFKELQILKFEDILSNKELKIYYQIVNNMAPQYIMDFSYVPPPATHFYGIRNPNIIHPPLARHDYSMKTLRYNMPMTVNNTPEINRVHTQTYNSYAIYLKKYRVSQYTNVCTDVDCYICNGPR